LGKPKKQRESRIAFEGGLQWGRGARQVMICNIREREGGTGGHPKKNPRLRKRREMHEGLLQEGGKNGSQSKKTFKGYQSWAGGRRSGAARTYKRQG